MTTRTGPRAEGHGSAIRTFVIADVRGYTSFSKQNGDEAAARLATKFATIAREGVEVFGGDLIETRGDEVLASFDSARGALRAAVELQDAFGDETALEPSLPLAVGIGIAAGEAVQVEDGFRGRALNLAARLCARAEGGEVLVAEELVGLAGPVDGIVFTPLDPVDLKGFDSPVPITKLAAREAGPPPAPAAAGPAPRPDLQPELDPAGPLVGRDREQRLLHWFWRRARHGHGQAIFVQGPSGIGKTRLAAELARTAYAAGASVRYAACAGPAEEALESLKAVEGDGRPALVIADDLDAAGGTVLDATRALGSSLEGQPILLLGTFREEGSPLLESLLSRAGNAQEARLALRPLGAEGVREIAVLYAIHGRAGLPLGELLEASGGVPALVHREAAEWASEHVSGRLSTSVSRTVAERSGLRAAEVELAENVIDLQRARERVRLLDEGVEAVVCPFKGLATFETADADYFFGRERLVAELVARLVGSGFLGVVGPSGSGKSSAVRAGLVPALAAGVIPGSERWPTAVIRPGEQPQSALAGAGLAGSNGKCVLVVDQFEELFTACQDESERTGFVQALAALAAGEHAVVVAVRADFYGRCAAYAELAELLGQNHVLVGPMSEDELRRAIELPARRAALRVEPGLVDALVADVEDEPGSLPLLSTALLELWQQRQGRRLTLERYRQAGGVDGAVARLAEEAYGSLSADQQQLARKILVRLAGAGESDTFVRRRAALSEFDVEHDEDAQRVLSVLTDARLLTTGEGTVEVAHEALLREWPRLRSWLEDDVEGRRLHLHLMQAATEWEQGGRDDADLYRGARLGSALDWTAADTVVLNERERRYLDASRTVSEREAERQSRANRRLRLLLAVVALLLAAAAVAGILALGEKGNAEEQAVRAERASRASSARELAAAADANLDVDTDRSLLLALEAIRRTRADGIVVREAEAALQNAVAASRPNTSYVGAAGGGLAASPDGKYFVATGNPGGGPRLGVAGVWETASGKRLFKLGQAATGVDYGPGGRYVAVGGPGDIATVADARTGRVVRRIRAGGSITSVEFGPTDRVLATVTDGGKVTLWELSSGRKLGEVDAWERRGRPLRRFGDVAEIHGDILSFDRAGNRLAAALPNGMGAAAKVWDLRSGALLLTLPAAKGARASDVDLRPDGAVLAVARPNGTLELRDPDSGKLRRAWSARTFALLDVEFSPDGRRLATSGGDGRVRLWDAATGRELLSLKLMASYGGRVIIEVPFPSVLSFSPDGGRLVSSGEFGVTHDWLLDLDDAAALARSRVDRSLTKDECRQYLHVETCPRLD